MFRLNVDAEGAETTIVRRAELILGNVLACFDQTLTNLLWRLDRWVEGVNHSDEGDLLHTIGILADSLAYLLVHFGLVFLGGELD